jgi:hypothetical protein
MKSNKFKHLKNALSLTLSLLAVSVAASSAQAGALKAMADANLAFYQDAKNNPKASRKELAEMRTKHFAGPTKQLNDERRQAWKRGIGSLGLKPYKSKLASNKKGGDVTGKAAPSVPGAGSMPMQTGPARPADTGVNGQEGGAQGVSFGGGNAAHAPTKAAPAPANSATKPNVIDGIIMQQ